MTDKEQTIEELLNSIPFRICKKIKKVYCYSCNREYEKLVEYDLKIKILQHEVRPNVIKKRFKMFYQTSSMSFGDARKYIGKSTGIGYLTLKEAFEELKGYLTNERTNNN